MRAIDQRIANLEKKRGLRGLTKFRFLILKDGDLDPPEIQDPDVFNMIVDLRQGEAVK